MSYTAALTPGEGGWICAETAEAPEPISKRRMLEEAKANVAEALRERAQVTVTPVAVPDSEPPRRATADATTDASASPPCGRQRADGRWQARSREPHLQGEHEPRRATRGP
jgi:hypothetical protein